MSPVTADPLSYQHLGFDDIRQWLADESAGVTVRHQFEQLHPLDDRIRINHQFACIAEIEILMEASSSFHVRHYEDLNDTLRLLALADSTLFPEDVIALNDVLEQTRILKKTYLNSEPPEGSVWKTGFEQISPLPELEQAIQQIIGSDGEVLDQASATLSSLRRKLRKSAGTVRSRMNEMVKKYADIGYLNDPQASIKG